MPYISTERKGIYMKKKRINPEAVNEKSVFICALIGGGVALLITLVLALLMPLLLLATDDPNSLVMPTVCTCSFLGIAVGAVISAKLCNDSFVVSGLLTFAVMFLPILLISLIIPSENNFLSAAVLLVSSLASSLLVSVLFSKLSGNRKRSMKRVMKRR